MDKEDNIWNITQLEKRNEITSMCSNTNGPRNNHTKWSKSERQRQISWYHLYVDYKEQYKWIYLQNRNRLIDIENKL